MTDTKYESYTDRSIRLAQEYTDRTTQWDCLWTLLLTSCHRMSALNTQQIADALDEYQGRPG